MVKLLIIADDFTGALDTGVQFSAAGIRTKVIVDHHLEIREEEMAQVLVISAETRHLPETQAYQVVHEIVSSAEKLSIPYIYKKTDSALRGNIGSELGAALDASGISTLPFIPAFPKMNRITRKGIHYIDGVPVSQSVFGKDPFEPVKEDSVREIIRSQCSLPVAELTEAQKERGNQHRGIVVYDASTDRSLEETAQILMEQGLCHVMAGCAGFAAILPGLLALHGEKQKEEELDPRLMVVCGSVNPITRKQLAYGESLGYRKVNLVPEQKLCRTWWDSRQGMETLAAVRKAVEEESCCILDSNDPEGTNYTMEYAASHQISLEEVRLTISWMMGAAAKKLMEQGLRATFLVTGGDTLLGMMRQIGSSELVPVCEIAPGSVLTRLSWNGRTCHIITKSGGFGEETLLEQIMEKLRKR